MKNRLYSIYQGMTKRCYYPDNQNYKYYGGKGIVICNEWKSDLNYKLTHSRIHRLHWDIEKTLTVSRV